MNRLSIDILNKLGEYFLGQLATGKKNYKYLDVQSVRKNYKKIYPLRRITNAFYYLSRRKYIQYKQIDGRQKFILTTQGAMQYFKYCELVTDKLVGKNKSSIVIIEAPENKREVRDFLRRRLTENKFTKIGRGVYVSEYKLNSNLGLFSKLNNLEEFLYFGEFKSF